MVQEFHLATGLPTDGPLGIASLDMRRTLINEEAREAGDELNHLIWKTNSSLAHLAKELADLLYVTYGTAVSLGIDLEPVFAAVHRSNMSKLGPDGRPVRRDDGKILKGPFYHPPDVAGVLALQRGKDGAVDQSEATLRGSECASTSQRTA